MPTQIVKSKKYTEIQSSPFRINTRNLLQKLVNPLQEVQVTFLDVWKSIAFKLLGIPEPTRHMLSSPVLTIELKRRAWKVGSERVTLDSTAKVKNRKNTIYRRQSFCICGCLFIYVSYSAIHPWRHLYIHVSTYHPLNYSLLHVYTVCTLFLIISIYLYYDECIN